MAGGRDEVVRSWARVAERISSLEAMLEHANADVRRELCEQLPQLRAELAVLRRAMLEGR